MREVIAKTVSNAASNCRPENPLALTHHALGQCELKKRKTAGCQQFIVTSDLGHQALLGRHGNHLALRQSQNFG